MKPVVRLTARFLAGALLMSAVATDAAGAPPLEDGFAPPPRDARTRCFWWWLNGNVTKAAITRDLEEMADKGFGGALIFDADSSAHRDNTQVPAGPMFGTDAWRELFRHALAEADRLGLELSLSIQSGWNLGGPDVTPEQAAKQLTWSETRVEGSAQVDVLLPAPKSRLGYYRDIAVLAYPAPVRAERGTPPRVSASSAQPEHPAANAIDGRKSTSWVSDSVAPGGGPASGKPAWLEMEFEEPFEAAQVRVVPRPGYGPKACAIQAGTGGDWRTIAGFKMHEKQPADVRFDAVKAKRFRLLITDAYDPRSPDAPRNVQVAEWVLLAPGGAPAPGMERDPAIQGLVQKAAFRELGGSAPDTRPLLEGLPPVPGEEDAVAGNIVDITEHLDADGRLNWAAPAGEWVVLRFGYTLTGARVSTASGEWQGLVLDYMSTPILVDYLERHVRPLLDDAGPLAGQTLAYLHTDSWECGGMNWTPGFEEEFRERRGYDPMPYLPVIAGKIIGNRDISNRFLADFRKTIGDCVADNHYAEFARWTHDAGLRIHPESGGPHAGPFDGITNLGRSDFPMGEFWVPSAHRPGPDQRFFVKQAASVAHVYGRRLVGAEGFTSIGPHWEDVLWSELKPSFDHEACAGLNLTFIHTFTCSPREMGVPGQEYFAGTHFNPNVTWWPYAGAFVGYLNRCHLMLQQGRFVADVCHYYGDHVPNIARRKGSDPAGALPGYDYDVISEEVLLGDLSVDQGWLVLPHGMRYRVLSLPDHGILSLAALEKVRALAEQGAAIIGPKPRRTASLEGYPASETRVAEVAGAMWGTSATGEKRYGDGRVVWGKSAREVLEADGVPPDCEWTGENLDLDFIHFRAGQAEIYMVVNRAAEAAQAECVFRVAGKQPELWDAVSGSIRDASAFTQSGGRTTVPLEFDPYGSLFVVFRERIPAGTSGSAESNFPRYEEAAVLDGPWTVRFDPDWGGPESTVFNGLVSWTERPETGVRYYSGAAVYEREFNLPEGLLGTGGGIVLDLGDVREIACVRLNGRDLGVCWTKPFRVPLDGALRAGQNGLEIEVVNNWPNRLIRDAGLPEEQRLTRTNVFKFKQDMPLTPSGLLGPVRILRRVN